jgi:hypothetical protein
MLLVCISVLVCVCMCISVLVCECMCMYVCMWVTFGLSTKVLSVWSLRSLTAPGKMQPKFSPLYQYMGKWVYRYIERGFNTHYQYMGIWVYGYIERGIHTCLAGPWARLGECVNRL